jgi:hypothetical protein
MPMSVVRDALDGMDIYAMSATELQEAIEENPDQVQVRVSDKQACSRTSACLDPDKRTNR